MQVGCAPAVPTRVSKCTRFSDAVWQYDFYLQFLQYLQFESIARRAAAAAKPVRNNANNTCNCYGVYEFRYICIHTCTNCAVKICETSSFINSLFTSRQHVCFIDNGRLISKNIMTASLDYRVSAAESRYSIAYQSVYRTQDDCVYLSVYDSERYYLTLLRFASNGTQLSPVSWYPPL